MSTQVANNDPVQETKSKKQQPIQFKTLIRIVVPFHLILIFLVFYLQIDHTDKVLAEMGGQMRQSYLSCCACLLIYFAWSQIVWSRAKKLRKRANVYRLNQHVYSVYELEEGEAEVDNSGVPRATESAKLSMKGKESKNLRVYMNNDGVEGEFNRAQRAIYNWHETMLVEIVSLLLCAVLLQFFMIIWAMTTGFGYHAFGSGYTKGVALRYPGAVMTTVSKYAVLILVSVVIASTHMLCV